MKILFIKPRTDKDNWGMIGVRWEITDGFAKTAPSTLDITLQVLCYALCIAITFKRRLKGRLKGRLRGPFEK